MMRLITLCLVIIILGYTLQARQDNNDRAYVYAVCMDSRAVIDGAKEDKCGRAQDKTNTEFLCTSNDTTGYCWVETK